MELEGLKQALVKIEEGNEEYKILVTDWHGPVPKYMRTENKNNKQTSKFWILRLFCAVQWLRWLILRPH